MRAELTPEERSELRRKIGYSSFSVEEKMQLGALLDQVEEQERTIASIRTDAQILGRSNDQLRRELEALRTAAQSALIEMQNAKILSSRAAASVCYDNAERVLAVVLEGVSDG